MFSPSFLFASLLWGSLGVTFLVYGTRQKALVPTAGGILIILASYCAPSALTMSVICMAIVLAVYGLYRLGY